MTRRPDHPGEAEIDAYLNDQLDLDGRIAVEEALARNPALAARVMGDLRIRDALRAAAQAPAAAPDARNLLAARRLQRGLGLSQVARGLRRGALLAACIGLGWLVHWQVDSVGISSTEAAGLPPRFTAEAMQAHRTSLLRAVMASQLEAPQFDRDEILRNTAIALPELPADWSVLDVQVYPAAEGPSVMVMFRVPGSGPLSLYLAHTGGERPLPLRLIRKGDRSVAYWRSGGLSAALVGPGEDEALQKAAAAMMARIARQAG
jgi:anti-sigma factor RsiW